MYEYRRYQSPYPALLQVRKTEDKVAFNGGRISYVEGIESCSDADQDENIGGPHG